MVLYTTKYKQIACRERERIWMECVLWSMRFIWLIRTCYFLYMSLLQSLVAVTVNRSFACFNLSWDFLTSFVDGLPDHYVCASSYSNTLTKFRAKQKLLPKILMFCQCIKVGDLVYPHDFYPNFSHSYKDLKESHFEDRRRSVTNSHLMENKIALLSVLQGCIAGMTLFHLNQSCQGQNIDGANNCFIGPDFI